MKMTSKNEDDLKKNDKKNEDNLKKKKKKQTFLDSS